MNDKKNKPKKRELFFTRLNVAVILGIMVIATLFMTFGERPNISLEENRDLTKCPEFSMESYFSGEFTKNFAAFYNDTVPMRSDFKLFISNFRAHLGVKYDGGVHLEGGLPDIDSRPAETSRPSSSKKQPPAVVLPQVPSDNSDDSSGNSTESQSEPVENISDDDADTNDTENVSTETSE